MAKCDINTDPDVKRVQNSFSGSRRIAKENKRMTPAKIWDKFHKAVFDATGIVKRQIRKALGIDGERLIRALELSAGGTAKGDVEFQRYRNEIYKNLTREQEDHLNEHIQARRNINIEKNRNAVARSLMNDKGLGTVFDTQDPRHIDVLKSMYKSRTFSKQDLSKRYLTIRKTKSDPRSEAVEIASFKELDIAQKYADAQVEKMLNDAEILNPDGLKQEQYEKYLVDFKEKSPKEAILMQQRGDMYFAAMKSQLGHMRQAGLITDSLFKTMASVGDYSPRRYMQFFDPDLTFNNMIPIGKGSTQALLLDSSLLMRDYMVRLHDRIARNEANLELLSYAEKFPGNPIIKIVKPEEELTGTAIKIKMMRKGVSHAVTMPHELGKEWGKIDAAIDRETATLLQTLSLSAWVRAGATGFNPGFAVTNFPRDIFFSWFRTREYSAVFPIGMWQMGKMFVKTYKDVWHRGDTPIGKARDFLEDGGMMQFMTAEGIPDSLRASDLRVTHKGLSALSKYASFLGQKTELWVRVALREQALQSRLKDGIPMAEARKEATWIARSYLDFSQGGKTIKMLDKTIPYLNAGMQATRGMFATLLKGEQAGRAPSSAAQRTENLAIAWGKFFQFFMLSSAVMLNNLLNHPEEWDKVPNNSKSRAMVFLMPELDDTNDHGETSHAYLEIALDQGQAGINAMAHIMLTQFIKSTLGPGDTAFHKYVNQDPEIYSDAIKNMIPFTSFLPPSIKAVFALQGFDTYKMTNVSHKGEMLDNGKEFLPWTHPAFIASAEKLNETWPDTFGIVKSKPFSPERMRLVWNTFFTPSNSFVKLMGWGFSEQIMDSIGSEDKIEIRQNIKDDAQRAMSNVPFFSRLLKMTPRESVKDRAILEKVKLHENSLKWEIRNEVDFYTDAINRITAVGGDAKRAEVKKIQVAIAEVLNKWHTDGKIDYNTLTRNRDLVIQAGDTFLANGRVSAPILFRRLTQMKPGGQRANGFFEVWKDASKKHKAELEADFRKIKRLGDDHTIRLLSRMIEAHNERNK